MQQEVRPEGLAGPARGPAMYAVTNLGYDVVALIDADGIVLRQYVYDPYGRVVEAHSLADHAPNRVGHKGLFFHRLDGPAQGPQLVGGAVGIHQARNRGLRPDLQRWMQQDPNGTGQVVLDVAAMHGGAACGANPRPRISTSFPDGLHRFNYLRASPPLRADSLGLLDFSLGGQVAMMAINAWDFASSSLENARQGLSMTFGVWAMLSDYRIDQFFDSEWALDWEMDDEAYSRSFSSAPMHEREEAAEDGGGHAVAGFGFPKRLNAWKATRRHGGAEHWAQMRAATRQLAKDLHLKKVSFDWRSVRTNQALVDGSGRRISNRRPDVQLRDSEGRIHIIEVRVSERGSSINDKRKHYSEVFKRLGLTGTFNNEPLP